MASLAWALEEGTRQFYKILADRSPDSEAAALFSTLVKAEDYHKETLSALNGRLTSEPVSRMYEKQEKKILEGGMELETALQWAEGKGISDILELSLGLEANAYDRYLRMLDIAGDDLSREVFRRIAIEEKGHLKRLAELMDEELKNR